MKCSTDEVGEIRGFQFLVNDENKEELARKIQEIKLQADSKNVTHILRIAESNYFRFELIFVPKAVTLLSVATARGTNNINLRNFESLENLATLVCCAAQNEKLKELTKGFLPERPAGEVEVVDLFSKREEVEINADCSKVQWKEELKLPETIQGKWTTSELAVLDNLSLKALAGPAKFISISTERPQNSIKFNNFDRLQSLCCFLNLIKKKLDEHNNLVEVIKPLIAQEPKRKRGRRKEEEEV